MSQALFVGMLDTTDPLLQNERPELHQDSGFYEVWWAVDEPALHFINRVVQNLPNNRGF